ncbi:glycosyltransferase family 2 protein [Maridesulfovibrio bastinii]|uniref:glycosyltransferase family 2 protein n=1 Tax=Maridesulfovibrio bastinii TaxID=47157 RepID=UPI000416694E|nr:glycosyltransferase family 2 protein [Maridesulfovibrio bastinii]
MKLIIQIPCFNEAETIGITLDALPRKVVGFDKVEYLIIDDGCSDGTIDVARKHGANYVVSHPRNKGLAHGFMTGLKASLALGADVIVNTDADNQYCGDDIHKLTTPIIEGKADIVVGTRPIQTIEHFSPLKKMLQRLGSWVVRTASGTNVMDAPSGFRAISRDAAKLLNVFNNYTYTLETIIQAGQANMAITSVDIRVNEDLRPSRLFSSIKSYIKRSIVTIVRISVTYRPFLFFSIISAILLLSGGLLGLRYLYYWAIGSGTGHVQSVVLSGVLLVMGVQTGLIAFVADLIGVNRRLLEQLKVSQYDLDEKIEKVTSKIDVDGNTKC